MTAWQIVHPEWGVIRTYALEKHAVLALGLMRLRKEAGAYEMRVEAVVHHARRAVR